MDEFISREETIKRIKEVYCVGCNSYHGVRCRACGTGDAIDMIEDAPAADVAPVVRCKDCKYGEVDNEDFHDQYLCHISGSDWNCGNHFCSYGERKDGDENG